MSGWTDHLVIAPIVVPMLAGAAMILAADRRRGVAVALGIASTVTLVALSVVLVAVADTPDVRMYRLGSWPSVFGIVLALDRLSAMMVALTSVLGLAALLFSLARWDRAGAHFHPLLQFQLMGLNGAFLTGDLFNLFVFFEVTLAASYGMALHGSGTARVRAGLHYIVINLVASLLFLVGVSVAYGVAGTLNMADLVTRVHDIGAEDRALLEAGLAVLGVAFLVKAAMWPFGFWLPGTYAAAGAPAAAILSILSKVGIYAVLRVWLLLFGDTAGLSAGFGSTWLTAGGLLTIAFGSITVLAAQDMARLAGASVLVSSGTLLAAAGVGQAAVTGGALFYLASSVLATAAFFLLIELVERGREVGADVLAVTRAAFGTGEEDEFPDERDEVGIPIPGTVAILGASFLACALLLAGLPPLSGFIAKFAILAPLLGPAGTGVPGMNWALLAALVLSGLATVVAMLRTGIDTFWTSPAATIPRIRLVEIAPVALLLVLCGALTIGAGPAMKYMQATADALHTPRDYLRSVHAPPPPPPGERR
ncbi:putative K(+)/H(+) antiporter subunit D (plasmid) [Rhodovastum atsumiense]|uniref:monovalent cation/H+ antiporter subunit D n=1 Tax=Rhodovastum atsumiense TaxID=504468 RepID=UPI002024FEB6|nr:monovalent cation/H+ antiporter subunit D [Rhodovastum atsumiense]CAH2605481.1 putative K(+)/H(+) antiporter subunit D [Rhodovastum atsumiense]